MEKYSNRPNKSGERRRNKVNKEEFDKEVWLEEENYGWRRRMVGGSMKYYLIAFVSYANGRLCRQIVEANDKINAIKCYCKINGNDEIFAITELTKEELDMIYRINKEEVEEV